MKPSEINIKWKELQEKIAKDFDSDIPDLKVVLFLIGVQELGKIHAAFKKDEKGAPVEHEEIALDEVAEIRGWKALGSKLSTHKVQAIKPLESKIVEVTIQDSTDTAHEASTEETIASKLVEPEEIEFPENSDSGTGEQLGLF